MQWAKSRAIGQVNLSVSYSPWLVFFLLNTLLNIYSNYSIATVKKKKSV